jgi:hypothetical protein
MNQRERMPRKKKKSEQPFPSANEPLSEYFKSKAYKDSFKKITISSFEEQEKANYEFWAHLTPHQRLELHYYMITRFFSDELKKKKIYNTIEIDTIH